MSTQKEKKKSKRYDIKFSNNYSGLIMLFFARLNTAIFRLIMASTGALYSLHCWPQSIHQNQKESRPRKQYIEPVRRRRYDCTDFLMVRVFTAQISSPLLFIYLCLFLYICDLGDLMLNCFTKLWNRQNIQETEKQSNNIKNQDVVYAFFTL